MLENEPEIMVEKSRTMMGTWVFCGYGAHRVFTQPATTMLIQSEDEDRALQAVEKCKILWEESMPELKKRWPLAKLVEQMPKNKMEMAHGGWILGIVGNPDKIRSHHPTIVMFDEAALMTRFLEAWSVAKATRALKILAITSAMPSEFREMTWAAKACEWPEYSFAKSVA